MVWIVMFVPFSALFCLSFLAALCFLDQRNEQTINNANTMSSTPYSLGAHAVRIMNRRRSSERLPDPREDMLEEERDHQAMVEAEHQRFLQDKMKALKELVKEIKQDDWKYMPHERIPSHVTRSMAWKQP
jgi:hypothetical protein